MLVKNQPLWMPKGSVRAILAIAVVVPFVAAAVALGYIDSVEKLAEIVVVAYFVQKAAQSGSN